MKTKYFQGSAALKLFGRLAGVCAFAFMCLLPRPGLVFGQAMPLEDKARYERSLEVKVEDILTKLLGPNQAKVVVQAGTDYTTTEKLNMVSQPSASAKGSKFKWDGDSEENKMTADYLLPGFPNIDKDKSGPGNASYSKQMSYADSFIKKLVVTIVLNKDLTDSEAQAVRSVVSEVLSMDQKRGDELVVIKTPFAPMWRTIMYTPDAMNQVVKYVILAFLGLIALIVVGIGFLKLAGAMTTMAKAQQGHQITMEMGKGMTGGGGGGSPLGQLEFLGGEKRGGEGGGAGGNFGDRVVFNVRPDQVVFLVNMMASEDPANVALVAAHLQPQVRGEFLRMLSPDAASEVISHMAKVRFVEPEIINTIKEELERRLSGALGGVQQVIEMLERVNLRAKKAMLEKLAARDAETARIVRSRIFLTEDLSLLSEKDISVVISNVKIETLASALWELPQALKDTIKKQMADKTWQMVEQTMKYGAPSHDTSEKAVEELVDSVLKLIRDGRIVNPLEIVREPAITSSAGASHLVSGGDTPAQPRIG